MLPFQTLINTLFMNTNTQQSDREDALLWWRARDRYTQQIIANRHNNSTHRDASLMTQPEIEEIWRKETQSLPIDTGEGELQEGQMTGHDWFEAYKRSNELVLTAISEGAKMKAQNKSLYDALEALVNNWIGEEPFKEAPQYKTVDDEKTGKFSYWTPAAKQVSAELIHKGIEALKKANPNYKQ